MELALPALYPIVNFSSSQPDEAQAKTALALRLARNGAAIIQVRAKSLTSARIIELCTQLRETLAPTGCRLIVNDHVDVALMTECGGVHVGDNDTHPRDARALLGRDAIVGYSTHNVADVEAAQDLGVDYLGFGPIFESPSKPGMREPRGLETLREACRASRLPIVAIGGISIDRAPGIFAAGAQSCAVITELERSDAPEILLTAYARAAR